ncbi:LLM class flavin-dependent oxidoreductase [Streptomyces sp. BI20]|uniref:LLM class flavin-dependent oxidoreductase n=1 Tax=Streptomyces sp. BI20 TaxID=3403460 RepID=UPI003C727AA2
MSHSPESLDSPGSVNAPLRLAVALDGAGRHPAAWRVPGARPAELFTPRYWVDLAVEAERGLLDFVTFEDSLAWQSAEADGLDGDPGRVRGRLDALLTAARVAPATRHLGLVPVVTATHTEPFHVSKAVATLDHVSAGRAGLWVRWTGRADEVAHVGRRSPGEAPGRLTTEAADHVEVVRRLWDSWEDDAEIRDVATGRFVDRERLHYVDFAGQWFAVRGPSITPRPPQGQPVVAVGVTAAEHSHTLAARAADLAFVSPVDTSSTRAAVHRLRAARSEVGRRAEPLGIFGELTVFLADSAGAARDRLARLDELAGSAFTTGDAGPGVLPREAAGVVEDTDGFGGGRAAVFTGTPTELADLLVSWRRAGLGGFRLRPGVLAEDLPAITRGLVPELRARGVFRSAYEADSLRGLLGLERPANRYATAR